MSQLKVWYTAYIFGKLKELGTLLKTLTFLNLENEFGTFQNTDKPNEGVKSAEIIS